MTDAGDWSKDIYESSISSRCWTYTPYDQGWEGCPELRTDDVLRQLVAQERSLSGVPAWARAIVERSINFPPFCPHGAFPQPYLEVLDATGRQAPPTFVHGCYTANRQRKERMQDYIFCLDAWLAGATPDQAAAELRRRGNHRGPDWGQVCRALWDVLGQRSELKELLVRRTLHRQRWWLKSLVWDDDARDVYCRDRFLGDVHCTGNSCGHYGNPDYRDPYFAEIHVPQVEHMENRLSEICPDWPWFRSFIHDSWLCAPKAFRFLERLLWCIGKQKRCVSLPSHPLADGDTVPPFLQCQDTYPNPTEARRWVASFVAGMRSWLSGQEPREQIEFDVHKRLLDRTPTKSWLVGLYLRKLEFLNPYGAVRSM